VTVMVDLVVSAVDAVTEEDRTTLALRWCKRVVSVLHLVTLCLTMDTGRAAADQMQTSWEKLVQFMGTNYRQDISNELQNKTRVTLTKPGHTPEVLARHAI
jgi:hypothetical protein